MKRNTRIIQISGLRGLFMAVFVVVCLAAGFIAFPSLVAMKLWNYAAEYVAMPVISIWQGAMLWAIVAISGFIINDKNKYLTSFSSNGKLSEKDIKAILERAKIQAQARALDNMLLKSDDFKSVEKQEDEKEKENV